MERVLVASMRSAWVGSALSSSCGFLVSLELVRGRQPSTRCYAVKSRIINEELSTHRDTWGKWLFGILDDTPLDRIRAVQAKSRLNSWLLCSNEEELRERSAVWWGPLTMWLAVPGRSSLTYDVAVVSSIEYSSREKARPQPPQPIASKQASKQASPLRF